MDPIHVQLCNKVNKQTTDAQHCAEAQKQLALSTSNTIVQEKCSSRSHYGHGRPANFSV